MIRLSTLLLENTCDSEKCKIALFVGGGIIAVVVIGLIVYRLIFGKNKKKGKKTGPKAPIMVSECKDKKWNNMGKDSIGLTTYLLTFPIE